MEILRGRCTTMSDVLGTLAAVYAPTTALTYALTVGALYPLVKYGDLQRAVVRKVWVDVAPALHTMVRKSRTRNEEVSERCEVLFVPSCSFRTLTNNSGHIDKKACYVKALEIDDKYEEAWRYLGIAGGGTVRGAAYHKKACYQW